MNFDNFKLNPKISAGIKACSYKTPTPIQEQSIPEILKGHDLLGLAQTGTGKTAAFVLPILNNLINKKRGKIRALIIAPTRELSEQIHGEISKLAIKTGLRSVAVYGGVSKNAQVKKIKAGVEILVACPGRLLDLLGDHFVSLANIECLVLDEADHMFDMGFLKDIRRILKHLPPKKQTLLFSATMPKEIRHLANDILTNPLTVQIGDKQPATTVSHSFYSIEQPGKLALLKHIIESTDITSALIFTRTKYKAKGLGQKLQKAGYSATSIQGNMSQPQRQRAMNGFKEGKFKIMVATDIAARGIDVSGISHVINFDIPDTIEAYTHRIGRTGRADNKGKAFTFAGRDDMQMIKKIEHIIGKKMVALQPDSDFKPPQGKKSKSTITKQKETDGPRKVQHHPKNKRSKRRVSKHGRKSIFGLRS